MARPTFLVIGAMKAGTSSLHRYLDRHPDVTMSDPKELDFFVAEKNWDRGLGWYEQHFADVPPGRPCGESSPNYTKHPMFAGVPERIASVLPEVRLVYLVRDPIERMRSHYEHAAARGGVSRPLEVELRDNDHLVACSSYGRQLETYLSHVPLERILVLPSERLRSHRSATVREVAAFVGAEPEQLPDDLGGELHRTRDLDATRGWRARAASRRHRRKLAGIREQLRERFAPDLARLHELTGVVIPGWEDVV